MPPTPQEEGRLAKNGSFPTFSGTGGRHAFCALCAPAASFAFDVAYILFIGMKYAV